MSKERAQRRSRTRTRGRCQAGGPCRGAGARRTDPCPQAGADAVAAQTVGRQADRHPRRAPPHPAAAAGRRPCARAGGGLDLPRRLARPAGRTRRHTAAAPAARVVHRLRGPHAPPRAPARRRHRRRPGRPAGAGRGRLGEALRRPGGGRAALAGGRRGVDPPGRPRRRVRARAQPRAAGATIVGTPRHPGRDERRHPRRRVAGGRDGDRLPPGQHRHRRARAAGVVRAGDRRVRRPGGGRARRPRHARSRPAAGPARAATSTTCWPGSTPRAARATSSPTSTRTACSRARTSSCCATCAPPPTARSSPSGGITELADLAALMELVADGRRGRDRRDRALRGPVHPRGRARPHLAGPASDRMTPRRTRDPVPRRRRRARGQGRELPRAARRRRPGRAGPAVRRRGRRRADLPRHLRLARGPRDHDGDRLAHGRAGVHPADRRRGSRLASTTSTGCCAPAPTRSR